MSVVELAGIGIGEGRRPLLIPDIGTFFNQDVSRAVSLVKSLKQADAQIIKGEVLHSADICLDDQSVEKYFAPGKDEVVSERYRSLIERKVLPLASYEAIFAECKNAGLPFITSVYDFDGADFSRDIGAGAIKIATSNIVHEPLIRHVSRLGLPVIIDTGKSTADEVSRALGWARDGGARDIVVEYSPPPPPAPVSAQNIRAIGTYRTMFGCPVGLSDHHGGVEMLYAAAALGVDVLEKGVCPDDMEDDQDVGHALPVGRFADVQKTCRLIWEGLGNDVFPPVTGKKLSRMGLVARSDLSPGATIGLDSVDFAFPAVGIEVEHWSSVQGRRITRDIPARSPIRWTDIAAE